MSPASAVCSTPGCPELTPCPTHRPLLPSGSDRRRARGIRGSGWDERDRNRRILRRDGYRCRLALPGLCIGTATEVDHIVPRHRGGPDTPANKQALCLPCHKAKTEEQRW